MVWFVPGLSVRIYGKDHEALLLTHTAANDIDMETECATDRHARPVAVLTLSTWTAQSARNESNG